MNLKKLQNYKINISEVQEKLNLLNNSFGKNNYLMINKYRSLLNEHKVLEHINNFDNVEVIIYLEDRTYKDNLTMNEYIENKLNIHGADIIVHTKDNGTYFTDIKILRYNVKYNKSMVNGIVGNMLFQIKSKYHEIGWANNKYKITDSLIILIEDTIYSFYDYKALVEFIEKNKNKYEQFIFDKGKNTSEICISVPLEDLKDLVSIDKIDKKITQMRPTPSY